MTLVWEVRGGQVVLYVDLQGNAYPLWEGRCLGEKKINCRKSAVRQRSLQRRVRVRSPDLLRGYPSVRQSDSSESVFGSKLDRPWIAPRRAAEIEDSGRIYRSKYAAIGSNAGGLVIMFGVEGVLHFDPKLYCVVPGEVRHFA